MRGVVSIIASSAGYVLDYDVVAGVSGESREYWRGWKKRAA